MKHLSMCLLLCYACISNAQDTKWGKAEVKSLDQETKTITYSYGYFNDFFHIKKGETEKDLIVGNEYLEVRFSEVQEGRLHMREIIKGDAFITQEAVDEQSSVGFAVAEETVLFTVMEKLVELTHPIYHPNHLKLVRMKMEL